MNENYDKIKEFVVENKYEILLGLIIIGAIVFKLWKNYSYLNFISFLFSILCWFYFLLHFILILFPVLFGF